jgi:hypothetical protein
LGGQKLVLGFVPAASAAAAEQKALSHEHHAQANRAPLPWKLAVERMEHCGFAGEFDSSCCSAEPRGCQLGVAGLGGDHCSCDRSVLWGCGAREHLNWMGLHRQVHGCVMKQQGCLLAVEQQDVLVHTCCTGHMERQKKALAVGLRVSLARC